MHLRPALVALASAVAGVASLAAAQTTGSEPRAPDAPALELLERGMAPRHDLRWSFEEGQRETFRTSVSFASRIAIDGRALPTDDEPPAEVEGQVYVHDVDGEGRYVIGLHLADPDRATTGFYRMDARGRVLGVARRPDDLDEAEREPGPDLERLERRLRRMQLLLPGEPVGVGARWRVVSDHEVHGVALEQVATYTVEAIEGARVELSVRTRLYDDRSRTLELPGLPPGGAAILRTTVQQGEGRVVLGLDRVAPLEAESRSEVIQVFRIEDRAGSYAVVARRTGAYQTEAQLQPRALASASGEED